MNILQGISLPPASRGLSKDHLDGISAIVNDDDRWSWSQSRGGGREAGVRGAARRVDVEEVIRQRINSDGQAEEEDGQEAPEQVERKSYNGL